MGVWNFIYTCLASGDAEVLHSRTVEEHLVAMKGTISGLEGKARALWVCAAMERYLGSGQKQM